MVKPLLVVRLRGTVNASGPVRETLKLLRLQKQFHATIIPDTPSQRGMLNVVRNYVAWCDVDPALAKELVLKRGRRLQEGVEVNVDGIIKSIEKGKVRLEDGGLKPTFALSPPRGGFKASSRRLHSQGGVLGENSELLDLVRRML